MTAAQYELTTAPSRFPSAPVQHRCACGGVVGPSGECSACRAKRLRQEAAGSAQTAPPIVHDVLRSSGRPLEAPLRAEMEARFGHDFSRVRVHTDARAADSARAVEAAAYTVGRDVVFSSGRYAPSTGAGKTLLAHELAHVAQQSPSGTAHGPDLPVGDPSDRLEAEAADAARGVAAPRAAAQGGAVLQRQPEGEKPKKPLIPIPVFDELDPLVIAPDVPGVPSFVRGQSVKLSTLKSILDAARGDLPPIGKGGGDDFCARILPGYQTAQSGAVKGMCCPGYRRDPEVCCDWRRLGVMSGRCCGPDEVVIQGKCVRPDRAPPPTPGPPTTPPTTGPAPTAVPRFPPLPPLRTGLGPIRFGTIESGTIDHFVTGRHEVPAEAATALDGLAAQIKLYREATVHVEGHTDSTDTEKRNQQLSDRRAAAVREELRKRGVDPARLIVEGFGETKLLFPGERTAEEMARNRRVEVWLHIPPAEPGGSFRLRPPAGVGP
jgi:outer membrane protein OmpA-like peptidoglycan-associated protein